jgi:GxxExxY protein
MNAPPDAEAIKDAIIKGSYDVYNTLGRHFLERVYEGALAEELRLQGLGVEIQKALPVFYKSENPVAWYRIDMLVEGNFIVEIKAAEAIIQEHRAQLRNYLKASSLHHGLIVNFGPEQVDWKRVTL